MTSPEFSWAQRPEIIAHQLTQEAQVLIDTEDNPVMRGHMIAAAIEEGAPLGATVVIANLNLIPDDDDVGAEEGLTSYEQKNILVQETVIALARQGRYEEADEFIGLTREQSSYAYLECITELIKRGYGGPDSARIAPWQAMPHPAFV